MPGLTGILIHSGNTSEDTSGCIIVGEQIFGGAIVGGTSTSAFKRLLAKLDAAQTLSLKATISGTSPVFGDSSWASSLSVQRID